MSAELGAAAIILSLSLGSQFWMIRWLLAGLGVGRLVTQGEHARLEADFVLERKRNDALQEANRIDMASLKEAMDEMLDNLIALYGALPHGKPES